MKTKVISSGLLALALCTPLGVWAAGENNTEESCLATFSVSDQTLTIPCVEVVMGTETVLYSAQLQQVEEGRFALTQVAELSAAVESECVASYSLETGELGVPCVGMQMTTGEITHYVVVLQSAKKNSSLNQKFSLTYFQGLDLSSVSVASLSINGQLLDLEALLEIFGGYFGERQLNLEGAFELKNIAVINSDSGYFIISKNQWMSPLIAFIKGKPTDGGQLLPSLVWLDRDIQGKITNGVYPSPEKMAENMRKWEYLLSIVHSQPQLRASSINGSDDVVESGSVDLGLWNIHQTSTHGGIQVNKYTQSFPVGCAPLAMTRIMNWYGYPRQNVFGFGNQYPDLNQYQVTDSFARLVADIGKAANAKYEFDGTSVEATRVASTFQQADYYATLLFSGSDTRDNASQLYIKIREQIKANRPSFLNMWWLKTDVQGKEKKVGHSLVVTGYKTIDPAGLALEDLYMEAAFGWQNGNNSFYDRNWLQLDAYTSWWSFVIATVTPGGLYKNFNYSLYGNISPKFTKYRLTVNNSSNGTVTSSPSGINCGNGSTACVADFYIKTSVNLVANPNSGYQFKGWSGACSGSSSTCLVVMSSAKSVTANFISSGGGTGLANLILPSQATISPNPLVQGSPITVTVNIANIGTTTFKGSIAAALHDSTGKFVGDIRRYDNQSLTDGKTFSYVFTKSTIVSNPGNYRLQIKYSPDAYPGSNSAWYVLGDTPIQIIKR